MIKKISDDTYEVYKKDSVGNEKKVLTGKPFINENGVPSIAFEEYNNKEKKGFSDAYFAADDLGTYLWPDIWQRTT